MTVEWLLNALSFREKLLWKDAHLQLTTPIPMPAFFRIPPFPKVWMLFMSDP